jgi:hypothetical protein
MAGETGASQARNLLTALNEHVTDITRKLERVEQRCMHKSLRGNSSERRQRSELRRDLHEAHRLIDGLYRRFPELSVPRAG